MVCHLDILRLIHVGERTPVRSRLREAGIPPFWDLCRAADEFRVAALVPSGEFQSLHYQRKLELPEPDGRVGRVDQSGIGSW